MWLVCSARCGGELFRALSAVVDVDSTGRYQAHSISPSGFVCLACGAPALDLALVPAELAAEEREDQSGPGVAQDILCPVCETLVTITDDETCPSCGVALEPLPN